MIQRLQTTTAQSKRDDGLTMIELLVAMLFIGILLVIAVPSYMGYRARGNESAARQDVRAILPAIEAYFANQEPNSYAGMTLANLKSTYDQSLDTSRYTLIVPGLAGAPYCVSSTSGDKSFRKNGPGNPIEPGACS